MKKKIFVRAKEKDCLRVHTGAGGGGGKERIVQQRFEFGFFLFISDLLRIEKSLVKLQLSWKEKVLKLYQLIVICVVSFAQ